MVTVKILPPRRRLKQLFDYDPDTDLLTRRLLPRSAFVSNAAWATHKRFVGQHFRGGPRQSHVSVLVDGVYFKVHRVIWKMVTGREPPAVLDHENRNSKDNAWANLRRSTKSQNCANSRARSNHAKGAYPVDRGKWMATITVRGQRLYLGRFPTEEAAHTAYCEAGRKHFGEFFHGG
jgi:hypothetical protein